MSNNFSALANSVVEKMGGASNVVALTHCMTRLRFVTKDEAGIDADALKKIKGVMGVVQNGDKCQVIVGNNVAAAYKEVMKLLNLDGSAADDAPAPKVKLTPKVIGAKMLDALVVPCHRLSLPSSVVQWLSLQPCFYLCSTFTKLTTRPSSY